MGKNGANEERKQIKFDYSVKYSELFWLPYFNPIKMHETDAQIDAWSY